ncbi:MULTISPECIES: TonB-dependent receptor [unclassified Sphingomonas]|uniref:TonB-dependent receptor n=1 Tax=unclassified Sphingomonas TaxID=196159 RepID=UPI0006F205B4|nr:MULTISPECIES: TonB-dependent receptor [unclassified Sphingomonas]KQM28342.1 TonB-dependent receptor [Sphingomonas sp. Leaf9]KQM45048.1 TonB-dependent receptor [Sphingomonas sp. Leaf11]
MIVRSGVRARLLMGAAALLVPVAAQAAAPEDVVPAPVTAAPEAPATDDASAIPDIVVTATRRETNLQKTPVAISVLGAPALVDRHVQSLYDLADGAVPSLRVATFEARQSALTVGIRGIVPLDANQPAREQGVGIYVDGVYLGRQHGLNAALFDVERIEVLKGPQGTLFGRNTEGGALNIVTRAPSGEFEGRIRAGVANYGGYNGEVHLDLPAYENVSVKLDGIVQYQGPTTKNPLAGQTGFNYFDRRGARAAVRWAPIDGLTEDFSYDYGIDKNSPFYSQLLNYNPNGCVAGAQSAVPACTLPGTAYTALTGTVKPLMPGVVINGTSRMKTADIGVPQQPSVDETHGFTNLLKYKLSPEIELRSITAWRGVDATQWDNSGGAHRVPVFNPGNVVIDGTLYNGQLFSRYSLADLRQRQFSQEFQAVGTVDRFDYVAGLFYFNEHVSDDAATPNSNLYNAATGRISIVNPCAVITTGFTVVNNLPVGGTTAPAGSQPGCRSIDRASEVWSKSYAAYGQVTWNATDVLHLTAGGRYTHDTKRGELHFSRNINYDTNTAAAARNGYTPLDATWNRFNPMVTLAYDAADNVHVYAKYATGYRAGGASSRTSNYQAFDPEDVKSYEVGMKSDFWDKRARLNLAAYIMDRKDSQVDISSIQSTATGNFNNLVTINAPGTTKIRGIEAELTVQPIDNLTLNASYAYTYTRIPPVLITNSVTNAAGVTTATQVYQNFYIVFTPRNAASGSIDYALPLDTGNKLRFHLDGNYAQATQAFDQFATKNAASFIVNGRVALADIALGDGHQKLTVALWGRNLFDEQYVYRRDPSNSLPGAPTTNVASGSINNVLGDYGNFNAPRTFGVEGLINF